SFSCSSWGSPTSTRSIRNSSMMPARPTSCGGASRSCWRSDPVSRPVECSRHGQDVLGEVVEIGGKCRQIVDMADAEQQQEECLDAREIAGVTTELTGHLLGTGSMPALEQIGEGRIAASGEMQVGQQASERSMGRVEIGPCETFEDARMRLFGVRDGIGQLLQSADSRFLKERLPAWKMVVDGGRRDVGSPPDLLQ